jgi:hypothetical protein
MLTNARLGERAVVEIHTYINTDTSLLSGPLSRAVCVSGGFHHVPVAVEYMMANYASIFDKNHCAKFAIDPETPRNYCIKIIAKILSLSRLHRGDYRGNQVFL